MKTTGVFRRYKSSFSDKNVYYDVKKLRIPIRIQRGTAEDHTLTAQVTIYTILNDNVKF
jgi:hypothetical protein